MRALRVVIDVGGSAEVSVVGEGPENSGCGGAGNGARVHLAKHHPCRLDETERGVDGEEFAGGAGGQRVSVIHTETVSIPIIGIPGQLGELVSAVGSGRERFLKLVVSQTVIATNPHAAFGDVNILGCVGGGFANDVGPRS